MGDEKKEVEVNDVAKDELNDKDLENVAGGSDALITTDFTQTTQSAVTTITNISRAANDLASNIISNIKA